jgi:hypothetical protein
MAYIPMETAIIDLAGQASLVSLLDNKNMEKIMSLRCILKALALITGFLHLPAQSVEPVTSHPEDNEKVIMPALGVNEDFNRWDTVIKLGYNPEGAPQELQDEAVILSLLGKAADRWSTVSGIQFEILETSDYLDDLHMPLTQLDRIVSVHWKQLDNSIGGNALAVTGLYDEDLGYEAFIDGAINLSQTSEWHENQFDLLAVLVHEIGHILGLGHSDNPNSLMFANPYNFLQYPMEDDIRAVQALYGQPVMPIDPSQPIPAWQYQPLPSASIFKAAYLMEEETLAELAYQPPQQAPIERTRYMFISNGHPSVYGKGPMFTLSTSGDSEVTQLYGSEPEDSYLIFFTPIGTWDTSAAIDISAELVLVNPLGQVHRRIDWTISCPIASSCINTEGIAWAEAMNFNPGQWHLYVVEKSTADQPEQLLYETAFMVRGEADHRPIFSDSYFSINDNEIADNHLTNALAEGNEWMVLDSTINNVWNGSELNFDAEIVVVNPQGYAYDQINRDFSCPGVTTCYPWTGVIFLDQIKSMSGTWHVYINDASTHELLYKLAFTADTPSSHNRPPVARLVIDEQESAGQVNVKVVAHDAEQDNISVTWPDSSISEQIASHGVSEWHTFNLGNENHKTFFISVNDDAERYSDHEYGSTAGVGFQTLLRLDLSRNAANETVVNVTSSAIASYAEGEPDLLTKVVPYQPTTIWPSPYNGITTPAHINLPVNNIAYLDAAAGTLFSCVNIFDDGVRSDLDGIEQFDINFRLVNLDTGIIQVSASRIFNTSNAVNEDFLLPDCSGSFDLDTGVYSDHIQVGNRVFSAQFGLSNPDNLTFTLSDAELVN